MQILGTPLEAIYQGEDREKFRALMGEIGEPVPKSMILNSPDKVDEALAIVGLPAIIRPAYTLGGSGGGIAHTRDEIDQDHRDRAHPFTDPPGARRRERGRLEGDRV